MATSSSLEPMKVIDNTNLSTLLSAIYQIIENNYVRTSRYESEMRLVTEKIKEANLLNDYSSEIDSSTGNLIFTLPDGSDNNLLSIDSEGNLILTDDGSETAEALKHMQFTIDHNGDLICTQILDRDINDEETNDP